VGLVLKETELKVLAELFKNARSSDREISKRAGVSQPTVSRTRVKLEKEGTIREYTIVPDFVKLGYQLAAITLAKMKDIPSKETYNEVRKLARTLEKKNPSPVIAAMKGIGLEADFMSVSFHKTYSEYSRFIEYIRQFPQVKTEETRSFVMDLTNREHFRFLILSVFADYLLRKEEPS
jgi:Lrp/AsnC family transcriptional regulator for asnA, asnC and gidA